MIKFLDTDITHRIVSDSDLSRDALHKYVSNKFPDCKYWDLTHHYVYGADHFYTLNIFFED